MKKFLTFFLFLLPLLFCGCREYPENPNIPKAIINFTIYPNSTQYFNLNIVSGWMYVTSEYPSRGIIIYRLSQDEFRAYDRIPPNEPDACCDGDGNCTRLIVDFPYVVDDCNNIKYNIINGDLFEGNGVFPLIQYHTSFDGNALHVFN